MSGDASTIKEFLVSLGFKIDSGQEKKFVTSIDAVTVRAVAAGTALADMAEAAVSAVAKVAENLEQLYFASKRTNATVENLQATGFAARQMGVDAGAALNVVENLARFLRNSPGGEGLLKNLGVSTRDANGRLRDTTELLADLGKKFAGMDYYKANAYAQALGIDEKTLMAMREGMGEFQQQYKDMLAAAGVDSQQAAKSSHEFMSELRLLEASFGVLVQKAAGSLTDKFAGTVRRTREGFVANFDRIIAVLKVVADWIARGTDAIAHMAIRGVQFLGWLSDWFQRLSPAGQKFVEILGAALVAWRALSLGFLASPIGIVVALGAALAGLVDDYLTWKSGGKSLIDWGEWAPGIEEAIKGIGELWDAISKLGRVLLDIFKPALKAVGDILVGTFKASFHDLLDIVNIVTAVLTGKWADAGRHASAIVARTVALAKSEFGIIKTATSATSSNFAQSVQGNSLQSATSTNPKDPRGIRNNNPGNINYGDWARAHGSIGVEAGAGGRFARFGSAQDGLNALGDLLRGKGYIGGGVDSVRSIISKYAPSSENNTSAYIASLSKRLGVSPDAHLDPNNVQQMAGLIDGIVRVENGKNPYSSDQISRAAGARGVELNQTTHITVNGGGGDAKGVAREVANGQNNVNGRLVRNMNTAAR